MKSVYYALHIMLLILLAQSVAQAANEISEIRHVSDIKNHLSVIQNMLPATQTISDLQGQPLAAEIYDANKKIIGYAYYTDDVIKIPAYSGKLIHTLVVIDESGRIAGIKIISHQEPILLVGISDNDLKNFTDQYVGNYVTDVIKIDGKTRDGYVGVDSISGATITVMVINETVTRSMLAVATSRGINRQQTLPEPGPGLETESMWSSVWRDKVIGIVVLLSIIAAIMLVMKFRR